MFKRIDDDIAAVYGELGIHGVKPRYSMALMFLDDEAMSIRDLAREVDVTHSAMSQTVSAMRDAGLVDSEPGEDSRSRIVSLTARGREIVPILRAEWAATEAALAALETELPYALSQVARDITAALDARPFSDRLREQLENGGRG